MAYQCELSKKFDFFSELECCWIFSIFLIIIKIITPKIQSLHVPCSGGLFGTTVVVNYLMNISVQLSRGTHVCIKFGWGLDYSASVAIHENFLPQNPAFD